MHSVTRIEIPSPVHYAAAKPGEGRNFTFQEVAAFVPASGPAILTATDGKLAAFVPAQVAEKEERASGRFIIPQAAVKGCKRTRKVPMPCVSLNGAAEIPGGPSFPLPDQAASFPPVEGVIPSDEIIGKGFVVSLNPELLAKLADALGSGDRVSLVIDATGKKPIVVVASGTAPDGAVGLLMPVDSQAETVRKDAVERLANAKRIIRESGHSPFAAKGGAA